MDGRATCAADFHGGLYHTFIFSEIWTSRWRASSPLDHIPHTHYVCTPMKTATHKPNRRVVGKTRPRMTRELAEARAVGGGNGKFDGVAFLRTLKK